MAEHLGKTWRHLLLIGIALLWAGCASQGGTERPAGYDRTDLTIANTDGSCVPIAIELAVTPSARQQGLMQRRELAANSGMLFVWPLPRPVNMWMRDTHIPLDMIFIAPDGRVSHIAAQTTPLSEALISSQGSVLAVLEVNGGFAARHGIEPGSRVAHARIDPDTARCH